MTNDSTKKILNEEKILNLLFMDGDVIESSLNRLLSLPITMQDVLNTNFLSILQEKLVPNHPQNTSTGKLCKKLVNKINKLFESDNDVVIFDLDDILSTNNNTEMMNILPRNVRVDSLLSFLYFQGPCSSFVVEQNIIEEESIPIEKEIEPQEDEIAEMIDQSIFIPQDEEETIPTILFLFGLFIP